MKKQRPFSEVLTVAMFLCFGLAVLAVAVYWGLALHYRLFSDTLEAPYYYWMEYYSSVLMPRMARLWLATCGLSVLAMVLLAAYGVGHLRKAIQHSRQARLAAVLCACTFPISLWLFLDLLLRALCLIA